MDIRRIIREEMDGFDWVREQEPELKTYLVKYESWMWLGAYTEEQARNIFDEIDLNNVNNHIVHTEQPGVRDNYWNDTISFEEIDDQYS
jgi:hypothetical protein